MSLELPILQALRDQQKYRTLITSVPTEMIGREARLVLDWYKLYFQAYGAHPYVDVDALESLIKLRGGYAKEDLATVLHLVGQLRTPVDEPIIKGIVSQLHELDLAGRVQALLLGHQQGDEVDLVYELNRMAQSTMRSITNASPASWIEDSIEDILSQEAGDHGLKLPTHLLREHIKGLLGGASIALGARPDAGKTSLLAYILTHLAGQLDAYFAPERPILWLNNEGRGQRIIPRIYQAALGKTVDEIQIMSNAGTLHDAYRKVVKRSDRIRVKDIHGASMAQVEQVIEAMNPAVVAFDMLANIRMPGAGGGNKAEEVEQKWQEVRELAVRYDFVAFSTVQVSADGDNSLYPPYSALKDSKCLALGTPVRMFDGSMKAVETIREGELVLGPDSQPRVVTGPVQGTAPMYKISGKGWEFACNEQHILTVIKSTSKPMNGHVKGQVLDVPLTYFLKNPSRLKHYTAVRVQAEYPEAVLPLDPYLFGLWLGDGAQRECRITTADVAIREYLEGLPTYRSTYLQKRKVNSDVWDVYFGKRTILDSIGVRNNKHIPDIYKRSSIKQRQALLAGLMDSDGYVDHGGSTVTASADRLRLIDDIAEVARSLGYRTSITKAKAPSKRSKQESYSVCFANTDKLPTLLPRRTTLCKLRQDRMTILPLGIGKFAGFTVDKDHRYVLGNYIATHNTGIQGATDIILMMGKLHSPTMQHLRGLSTAKNKFQMPGKPSHVEGEVQFDAERCRFIDG
jgi:hypothetical protein